MADQVQIQRRVLWASLFFLTLLLIPILPVSAAGPVAGFTSNVTSGTSPLTVSFTDSSTGLPTGWAWFFGDENYTAPWIEVNASAGWTTRTGHCSVVMQDGSIVLTGGYGGSFVNDVWRSADNGVTWTQQTASAGWSGRNDHSCVVLPDDSIVLMGGGNSGGRLNDTWRSTDYGITWTQVNVSAGWTARESHSSVVMPDGSIVMMGGTVGIGVYRNDIWRFTPAGSSLQSPSHTYATLGTFNVSLTARNAGGFNTSLQSNYIKVSDIQAGFTWTCNATVPYRVDFHSTSTTSFPPIGSLWWTFGDGGSDMLDNPNPMHTYADASPMTVLIQAWDALNVESNATSNITPCSGGTPFISAMANQSIGPVGSVFHFSGTNTYGTSPGTYTNIFVANSTTGAGPLSNGVLPGNFSVYTITGDNTTIHRTNVSGAHTWTFNWNTSAISGGSILPGSSYTFYFVNRTANRSDLIIGGAYAWTKVGIGIEGPVHADYAVSPVSGTAPLDVTFTDLSTGFPERYNLSFGDGTWSNTSSLISVVHTYPSTGVYSPVMYINNSISSDSGTNTTYPDITVSSDPIAIIGAGGTVFIGESGLDITAAVPVNSSIAWWPPMSDINITAPTKIIASPNRSSFFVSPTNFVGYTGDWYVYTGLPPPASLAFIVKDPQLDLGIEDVSKGTDITNGTLQRGDELGFLVNSNLFNGAPGTPISVIVRSPSGANYSALVNKVGTTTTLSSILVSSQPFHTGALWDTSNGLYPVGAYTVHAECNVNGMKDNYKNGGVDYVGKTVSQAYTITLVSPVTTSSGDYGGGSGDSSAAPASVAAPPAAAPPVAQLAPPVAAPPPAVPLAAALPAANPGIAAPLASQSYPMGFQGLSFNANGQNSLSIDTDAAKTAGATVTSYFNRVEVYQHHSPGVLLTFWGDHFEIQPGKITGPVSRAEFVTDPLNATLAFGNVSGSVHATLPALTQQVSIDTTIPGNLSTGTLNQFQDILGSNRLQLNTIAYTLNVKKVDLTTGPANVTFTIPASWVNQHGGKDAVRITRISNETGKQELIDTIYRGLDAQGNMIFRGDSPNGTSLFGLLTAKATAAEQEEHPNVTYIPASRPAMVTNVGMVGWLLDLFQKNPLLIVAVLAVIAAILYFGWFKRRL